MLSITLPSFFASVSPGLVALGLGIALLPWLNAQATLARSVVVGLLIALMARYMWWRVCCTLPPAAPSLEWGIGLLYLLVEALAVFAGMMSLFFLTRTRNRSAEADAHAAWFEDQPVAPLIDVLICTYNEEQEIVERTIIGALSMEYPNFRTWVLDDGRRPWLELLCQRLGCGYVTRSDNAHAKAGNINNALRLLERHERRPDFISILDADFVPKSKFLERAISLFYQPDVGVGADAATLHQPGSDPEQPDRRSCLARRAALLFRYHHGLQGRLVGSLLLRNILADPIRLLDEDRRISHRLGHGRLFVDPAAQGSRLPDSLS
jgi:cellulose synthase (UDP-forming)